MKPGPPAIELEAELDRLYAAPLAEFVEVRNALWKRLRAAGAVEEAGHVKGLRRPSVPAWAVNQVRLLTPAAFEALAAASARLRSGPTDAASAMRARREALAVAVRAAEERLTAAGYAPNLATSRSVAATLEALAAFRIAPGRPVAGRLSEELPAPAFDELMEAGLAAGPAVAPAAAVAESRATPATDMATSGRKAEAERLRTEARRAVEKARADLAAAEKEAEVARRRRQELEASLADAVREERERAEALTRARAAAEEAGRA